MRARALFAGTVGVLFLAVATPAAAKAMIAEAQISGPGLGGGGLRISAPATEGMWESGIDVAGGLDDARAGSIAELGLTAVELGPSEASPQTAEVPNHRPRQATAGDRPLGRIHSGTRGLSDRPPPPAAPRSDRLPDRLATPKVAGQTTCLLMWSGRLTLPRPPRT